jgi:hypothetical protein
MIRVTNIRKWGSFCGVVLGLLLVCNIATPLVAEGSDVEGGWWIVRDNDPCWANTVLDCPAGQESGVFSCGGLTFNGVRMGGNGYVRVGATGAGCSSSLNPDSYLCPDINQSSCLFN